MAKVAPHRPTGDNNYQLSVWCGLEAKGDDHPHEIDTVARSEINLCVASTSC